MRWSLLTFEATAVGAVHFTEKKLDPVNFNVIGTVYNNAPQVIICGALQLLDYNPTTEVTKIHLLRSVQQKLLVIAISSFTIFLQNYPDIQCKFFFTDLSPNNASQILCCSHKKPALPPC
jgi:hypothetical protein